MIQFAFFNHRVTSGVLLLAMAFGLGGCKKTISDQNVHWLSIDHAKEAMGEQTSSWFESPKINAWVDARDPVFYRVGHVPGALNVQLSDPDAMSRLEPYGLVIVYGEGYEALIADAMIKALLKQGMKDVRGLQVGFEGWSDAGEPIVKGDDPDREVVESDGDRWQRQPVKNGR